MIKGAEPILPYRYRQLHQQILMLNLMKRMTALKPSLSGTKGIGIKTSVLEEKATACNMLCCCADELKEGFFPWIDQVASTLVPLLKFYFHEEVRKAAVSAMPVLWSSVKLAIEKGQSQGRDTAYLKQLSDYIIPNLVEALHKEPEVEICASKLDALNECIHVSGPHLDDKQANTLDQNQYQQAYVEPHAHPHPQMQHPQPQGKTIGES
ncbi:hypothetical protein KIW84_022633 [Lathyrus oleraceus]|uniref:Uncharacterized protein n=1 Tax=Pisum sativum TaxID=3888 RepID=A0A9D5B6W0_PEA|nr:hypothetical protein KIW84_022633 [Pisum sativum]